MKGKYKHEMRGSNCFINFYQSIIARLTPSSKQPFIKSLINKKAVDRSGQPLCELYICLQL
ncbi:hypothetical protein PJIAN_1520 [Paludibacter jiangxiensis]|uniref:Uncharacterized protein n=1 Tax=Paludibacter jiangxiensis TaxID=681398 RepID=A0A170YN88_9BACT|nr:hypothetical protein PJIAN_1520 [Paludibacter jiangxiensis]